MCWDRNGRFFNDFYPDSLHLKDSQVVNLMNNGPVWASLLFVFLFTVLSSFDEEAVKEEDELTCPGPHCGSVCFPYEAAPMTL